MEVRAVTRYVRITPEKARHVARLLQGKSVDEALRMVDLIPRKAARLFAKTLKSAVANAENNHELEPGNMMVLEATVGEGPRMKRFVPKARGMAGPILKRTSHLKVILTDELD